MSDERRQVLDMLAAGQISADEADRLLRALDGVTAGKTATATATAPPPSAIKYLRIQVDGTNRKDGGPVHINVRVPIALLRAGVRLTNFIPPEARQRINEELRKNGMEVDVTQIRPENLDEVIAQLRDLTIDIDHQRKDSGRPEDNVRIKINAE
jgi:hypothetical protein